MRVKKQKRHRRAVRFYTVCFGFRQPYKVLCDGTFIHHLIVNKIAPADTAISNILGGSVKLFTTRCVLAELKRLGKPYAESLEAAKLLMIARGLRSGDYWRKNPDHFFVGSQDTDMRKKFHEVPGVPLIYGLRNALFLEPPSAFQQQFAKNLEEERSHMTQFEATLLKKRTKDLLENQEDGDSSDENGDPEDENLKMQPKRYTARKGMDVKDRPQFKRKKAKGPNPLSVQKKKSRQNPNSMSGKVSESLFLNAFRLFVGFLCLELNLVLFNMDGTYHCLLCLSLSIEIKNSTAGHCVLPAI
ncbi:unnamed protein product [Dovyalis caffra]|uniref:UTP23 sensor motif region domain-containing protein n=1 Tax=Dovyalis caffra TaxID=77055 RepID=A0AAV1R9I0_9ROSI|nr:unnamed protein product [Dovyalis caffra]